MRNPRRGVVPSEGRRPARSGAPDAGWVGCHSGRRPLSLFVTVFRWHLRIGSLYLARDLFRTPQGWGLPVLLLISIPALVQLVAEGAWPNGAGLDAQSRAGALALAHATLVLCLAAMLPPTIVRDLVSWRERDPMEAHPWALPEAGLARIAGGALWTSGFLVLFFLLFHHPIVRGVDASTAASALASGGSGGARTWLLPAVHAVALFLHLVGLAALGFRLLAGWASQLPPHNSGLPARHRLLIFPFLLAFPAFALVPGLLAERMPGLLSGLGGAALSGNFLQRLAGWLLQPPAAGVFLAAHGEVGAAAAWFGASFGVAGLAGVALWRNRADLALVGRAEVRRPDTMRAPAFETAPAGSVPVREFRLFWEKDVRVRRGSGIPGRVREHGPVLFWIAAAAWLAPRMVEQTAMTTEAVLIPSGLIPIVLAAGASLRQGVPSLGLEGLQLELLRTLLPVRRLFIAKLSVNTLVVLPRAAGYAAAASLALSLSGVPTPGPGAALVLGAGAGAVLSVAATAVGFLLPDPAQRSMILPGASISGQLLFGSLAGVLVLGQGVTLHLFVHGEVSVALAVGLGLVTPFLVGAGALLLTLFALHRLENLDR